MQLVLYGMLIRGIRCPDVRSGILIVASAPGTGIGAKLNGEQSIATQRFYPSILSYRFSLLRAHL